MKQNSLYLYACVLMMVCSCGKSKEQTGSKLDKVNVRTATTENVNDIMGFYTFMETPTNGMFGAIHHSVRPATASRNVPANDNYRFSGAFYDANNNLIPGGKVVFSGIEFSPVNNFYSFASSYIPARPSKDPTKYSSLEGQIVTYSINPNPATTTTARVVPGPAALAPGYFYIPKKVSLATNGAITQVGNNYFDVWNWQAIFNPLDLTITWNADAQNDKGVVIGFEYDQELSSQFYSTSPAYSTKRYKAFRVPDNGSYTIKLTDLNEMWPGRDIYKQFNAVVTLTVGRANYAIVNSPDNLQKYSIYAGSAQETLIVLNWGPWPRVTG
ncbi:hypothetical protein [Longitalea luteola]|uniref:hypothetical protein n=1 Tax=Longitalea luteola TaxID=2812563 RepID=UPI001A970489|nr:hypothetical protein [Longitalea luteola]